PYPSRQALPALPPLGVTKRSLPSASSQPVCAWVPLVSDCVSHRPPCPGLRDLRRRLCPGPLERIETRLTLRINQTMRRSKRPFRNALECQCSQCPDPLDLFRILALQGDQIPAPLVLGPNDQALGLTADHRSLDKEWPDDQPGMSRKLG